MGSTYSQQDCSQDIQYISHIKFEFLQWIEDVVLKKTDMWDMDGIPLPEDLKLKERSKNIMAGCAGVIEEVSPPSITPAHPAMMFFDLSFNFNDVEIISTPSYSPITDLSYTTSSNSNVNELNSSIYGSSSSSSLSSSSEAAGLSTPPSSPVIHFQPPSTPVTIKKLLHFFMSSVEEYINKSSEEESESTSEGDSNFEVYDYPLLFTPPGFTGRSLPIIPNVRPTGDTLGLAGQSTHITENLPSNSALTVTDTSSITQSIESEVPMTPPNAPLVTNVPLPAWLQLTEALFSTPIMPIPSPVIPFDNLFLFSLYSPPITQ
ncbi:hypothetical protein BDQ17DRAFT_1434605 [Cyathus striatus]|nr:hypothetical protein BDQ17DRAFT_1434605 [Cyathus striatus]